MSKLFGAIIIAVSLTGCGIQSIPQAKNNVESTLAEVTNQYKRRADLIPNLVETVKGYAKHENETLTNVVEARAKATSVQVDPTNLDPQKLQQFQDAQGSLSAALGRLMVVAEKYPDLKADQNFRDLQAQLEGTENRITVARQRHIEAIQQFNNLVTVPPTSWTNSILYHHQKLPQWSVANAEAIQEPPKVGF
ncbi:MAG TPA: LemA family protein [Bdellovibrionales bacterium]|nr:LemA family protein [Bdellovibrionales bacterium]